MVRDNWKHNKSTTAKKYAKYFSTNIENIVSIKIIIDNAML